MSSAAAPAPAMLQTVLPCELSSAGVARRIVRELCQALALGDEAADDAQLLTSEVVTNAVTHGRSEVRLSVRRVDSTLRVEVGDDNSRPPTTQPLDDGALDGRGLAIVELVAARWGIEPAAIGKVVWFEVASGS